MEKYILKSDLVAEIERRIKTNKECMLGLRNLDYYQGKVDALNDTISSLDTLEVKEANSVWHDAIELPDETSLILLSLKDGNFILADEKTAYIRELVDKWCYVSDI